MHQHEDISKRLARNAKDDIDINEKEGRIMNVRDNFPTRQISLLGFLTSAILTSTTMSIAAVPTHTPSDAGGPTQRSTGSSKRTGLPNVTPGPQRSPTPSDSTHQWFHSDNLTHLMFVGEATTPDTVAGKSEPASRNGGESNKAKTTNEQVSKAKFENPAFTPEQQKQCADVVANHFAAWIKLAGGSGDQITLPEIGKLLEMPDLPPKEAAAIAALAHYFYALEGEHDTNPVNGLTLKQIEDAINDPSNSGSTSHDKFAAQLIANFHTGYENVRQDTHKNGWSLWGDHDPPVLSENVQWKLNDCYLISAINGLINNDPDALSKMIKQTGPDTFVVNFPGHQGPVDVTLTPGEVAAFSYSRHGGCYLAVVGMAVVKVMNEDGTDKNQAAAQTPLGALTDTHTFGWVQKNTFNLLTGKEFVQIPLKNYTPTEWKEFIEIALSKHELIGTDYAKDQHFLTIIGVKDIDGQPNVVIKNPWGNSRPFEGHEGKDGVFTIPLADMVSTKFGSITIQKTDFDKVTKESVAKAGASTPEAELNIGQGSAFICHNQGVVVHSPSVEIHIPSKSPAYVVRVGNSLAVYNLSSRMPLKVSTGNQTLSVPAAHSLIVGSAGGSFEQANPRPGIPCTSVKNVGNADGLSIYDAQFSMQDALSDAPGFVALLNSTEKSNRKVANELLKAAAANTIAGE